MEPPKVRAETWVQKEKYKNELQDALDMIIFDSEDPTGYLLADHCYKEKGNKEEAIEVFNMGLKHVSVTHNNDEALCQRKQEAGSRKAKRMDILGQLPREISNHIIGTYFDQESITPCSRVCSTWRNIILNHSEFWKRMTIGKPTLNSKVISPYHMLLPSICQYVQEIEIFNIINSRVTALFELFQTNNFSKIQSLKIRHSNYCK
ncbi:hypothetical protein INT45_002227 [Circinella minor]|uniref:F-box domain-containing protein n=1 Tax=Circinella minor TaxID=1195481 RepID=A0A8H7VQF3_9FUNG|nr:hypothetical protein INT45_002227 [Circinella minor]